MTKPFLVLACLAAACGDDAPADPTPDAPAPDAPVSADAPSADAEPPPGPSITFFDYVIAVDVTPDGRTAVFEDLATGRVVAHRVDTVTGAVAAPVDAGDPSGALVTAIASTGRLTAIQGDTSFEAGVFDGTAWRVLPNPYAADCAPSRGSAWDVSADGQVVVGMMWNGCSPVAFRWQDGAPAVTPLQVLGATDAPRAPSNRATVISDDGAVVAGFAENTVDRSPALWRADGTGLLLDPSNHDTPGEILSINADGSRVAGISGNDGFVWSEAAGMTTLPRLDSSLGDDPVYPNAMSADGALVFGGIGNSFFSVPFAFVWSEAQGTRDLTTIVRDAGLVIPEGTVLGNVLGASADGTVLVGTATTETGATRTFFVRLSASAL